MLLGDNMKYSAIVLAAGSSSRMNLGYNKILVEINDKPLITLSVKVFVNDPNCSELIIVVHNDEINTITSILSQYQLLHKKCKIVAGGSERQYSVYNGLQSIKNNIVLVHDGARPFITNKLIETLVTTTNSYDCVIPGVKVKDTIKLVKNNIIMSTLPRENLYAVQTPQACITNLLKHAHDLALKDHYLGTDEASLMEKYLQTKIKIIDSSYNNIKITTREDIIIADAIAKNINK